MKRARDCGVAQCLVDSDHLAIECKLRIAVNLKKPDPTPRQRLGRLDFNFLRGPPYRTTDEADENREEFNTAAIDYVSKVDRSSVAGNYPLLSDALTHAALEVLPKRPRASPGWFEQAKDVVLPLIAVRNDAMAVSMRSTRRDLHSVRGRLICARKMLKIAIARAKNNWITRYVEDMNANDARGGTVASWKAVGVLKAGLSKTRPVSSRKMRKPDGSFAETAAENAEGFGNHFDTSIFGR